MAPKKAVPKKKKMTDKKESGGVVTLSFLMDAVFPFSQVLERAQPETGTVLQLRNCVQRLIIIEDGDRCGAWADLEPSDHELYEVVTPFETRPNTGGAHFLVFLFLLEECADEFVERIVDEAAAVKAKEPDTLHFAAYRQRSKPCNFVVYEVFKDEAALEHHAKMPHYLEIKEWLDNIAEAHPRSHDDGYILLNDKHRPFDPKNPPI